MGVGIRALRDELSRYLSEVKRGHTITVTERGRPIARIVPITELSLLERLQADGRVSPARRRTRAVRPAVTSTSPVSDLVIQQRR
jgi:prevent-host-death family protein